MKEQDLDKLFAQKLGSRQFAFKEAYWDQMAGSLGGRRAGAWWIYLLLLVGMGASSLTYYYMAPADAHHAELRVVDLIIPGVESTSLQSNEETTYTNHQELSSNHSKTLAENPVPETARTAKQNTNARGQISSPASFGSSQRGNEANAIPPSSPPLADNGSSTQPPPGEFNVESGKDNREDSESGLLASAGNELPKAVGFQANNTQPKEVLDEETRFDLLVTNKVRLDHSTSPREFEGSIHLDDDYFDQNSRWSVSAFMGVSLTQRELSGGSEEYENKRLKEETILPTWHGGIEAHYQMNGWQLSSGLNYVRIGEKTSYTPEEVEIPHITETYVTQEITTSYWLVDSLFIFDEDTVGFEMWMVDSTYFQSVDTMQVLVTDTAYTTSLYDVSTENELAWFEYVEIPLMVGYGIEKNRWSFGLRAGMSVGILTGHGGKRVSQQLDALVVDEGSTELRKIMMNYQLRFSVGYKILPGTSLYVEPAYRNMARSVFKNTIDQRYRSYGLNIGLLYNF